MLLTKVVPVLNGIMLFGRNLVFPKLRNWKKFVLMSVPAQKS